MPKPCHGDHWATVCWFYTDAKTLPFPDKPMKRWARGDFSGVCILGHRVRRRVDG